MRATQQPQLCFFASEPRWHWHHRRHPAAAAAATARCCAWRTRPCPCTCTHRFSSIAWTHDNAGFFYNRYKPPPAAAAAANGKLGTETDSNTDQLLCYHVLGTPQEQDTVVLADPDHPLWLFGAEVSDDGRCGCGARMQPPTSQLHVCSWAACLPAHTHQRAHQCTCAARRFLLVYVSEGCQPQNRLYYVDLAALPQRPGGGPDFSSFDFFKGEARQLAASQ